MVSNFVMNDVEVVLVIVIIVGGLMVLLLIVYFVWIALRERKEDLERVRTLERYKQRTMYMSKIQGLESVYVQLHNESLSRTTAPPMTTLQRLIIQNTQT
jgi:type II secretory pathway pseudopilin PulG